MKHTFRACSLATLAGVAFVWLLATPAPATAQAMGAAAAAAAAAGGSSSGGSSGGGSSSGGSSGGGSVSSGASNGSGGAIGSGGARAGSNGPSRAGATGGSGYSAPRGSTGGSFTTSGTNQATGRTGSMGRAADAASGVPEYARPRDGREAIGTAVLRGSVPSTGGGPIVVRGGYYGGYYDPWWYGPGYAGDYGGYYDPWYGGYPSYPQTTTSSSYVEDGKLRLKIKPREAEVFVDGYFAGIVDDFDGILQRLHLDTGAHHIEVRAPGYEPLTIEVRITPDRTTTYEGELKRQ